MRPCQHMNLPRPTLVAATAVVAVLVLAWPVRTSAQDEPSAKQNLMDQIHKLQSRVVHLEAALKHNHKGARARTPDTDGPAGKQDKTGEGAPGVRIAPEYRNCLQCHQTRPSGPLPASHLEQAAVSEEQTVEGRAVAGQEESVPGQGMGMMGGQGMGRGQGMGMMGGQGMGRGQGMGMIGGTSGDMRGMDTMEMMGAMGMAPKSAGGMAGMKSMGEMQMQAALPGFPGASHIYHVGATDFFLNHPEHITLTPKQKGDLVRLKEKAVLAKTSAQRKIDGAEQELWILTSADEPDVAKIEAKIHEIEKLRGDQRMALIRAVGDAAKLLTDEQRQSLLGSCADESAGADSTQPSDTDESADADKDLPAQVRELQARIANLEAALNTRP